MNLQSLRQHYLDGRLLLIDKPVGWTSFDVVKKIRLSLKINLGIKKIKVGHAGTLDPLATGLLIVCIGKSTKKIETYQAQEKTYTGTLTLGATTPSCDLETEIDKTWPFEEITEAEIREAAQSFSGTILQRPPAFSALKVDGERAYKAARRGEEVKVPEREVHIETFDLTRVELPEVDFRIVCSKGTYIRTIAYDLGRKLNNGAHLSLLRRTAIGDFEVDNALEPNAWVAQLQAQRKTVGNETL